jgi:hypothetical protein
MALQGTLKDFSIADIFQLIGQQGKSGSLIIVSDEKETHIVFDKGSVVLARFNKGHDELKLGGLLQRAGIVTRNQLALAFEEHKQQMRSLGDVLLSKNYVTKELLAEFMSLQTREVLFRVFQWKSGVYKFKAEEFHYNAQIITPMSTDFVLMDGFRQLDEWPGIMATVGSFDGSFDLTVIGREIIANYDLKPEGEEVVPENHVAAADDAIDAAFAEFDQQKPTHELSHAKKAAASEIDDADRKLLPLINGHRSLKDLIDKSRLGTFETANKLAFYIKNQWVTQLAGLNSVTSEPIEQRYESSSQFKKLFVLVGLTSVMLFTVGALIFMARPIIMIDKPAVEGFGKALTSPNLFGKFLVTYKLQRIKRSLNLYYLENLDYPNDLDQLAIKELLPSKEVDNLIEDQFYYIKSNDAYVVLPPPNF